MSKMMRHGDYIDRAETKTEEQFEMLCEVLEGQGRKVLNGFHDRSDCNALIVSSFGEHVFWGRYPDREHYCANQIALSEMIGADHD